MESKTKWVWGTDQSDPHDYSAKLWAFDIETNGKDLNDPALEILLLGINDGKNIVVYGPEHIKTALSRINHAQHNKLHTVQIWGHNSIGFDAEVIFRKYGLYPIVDDTFILAHQIDEQVGATDDYKTGRKHGQNRGNGKLETLAIRYLDVEPWKEQVVWDWDKITDEEMELAAQYNAEDCEHTFNLANCLLAKAEEAQVIHGYELSKGAAISFEHFVNPVGVEYDLERAEELKASLTAEAMSSEYEFKNLVGRDCNLQSPIQLRKILFEESGLGLHPTVFTAKTKAASTNELALKTLLLDIASGIPTKEERAIRAILKYRENRKLVQFLESWEELQRNGRLFPEYSVTSTVSYRTSSFNPNVQQWPHDPRIRSLLTAGEGNVLTEGDYSQMELRLIAELSGSETMRRLFLENIDPHRFMASVITGKPMELVTSDERYVAKPVNFGLGFGGSTYTLRKQALLDYDIVLSETEATRIHDLFHSTYQLEPWYEKVAKELRDSGGQIRNPIGRIRHLPDFLSANPQRRLEAFRQALNFPIQSFACDIALLAIIEAINRGLGVVAFIHDAIYIESPERQAQFIPDRLREIMVDYVPKLLKERVGVELTVPLDIDVKQTTRGTHANA